ncbi:hypothetical protein U9R90_34455, partial [Streptomyces sp. E11-3]|uniref:hypothetical protein n=1 Tax=Streptomyces sp. E11-3 TaxID=3110112 RepID=UPI00398190A1
PAGKPRWRDRYTTNQLAGRGALAFLTAHAVALFLVMDEAWPTALLSALLVSVMGGMISVFPFIMGCVAATFLPTLWRFVRGGRRVRADFVRRQPAKSTHQDVFAVTDSSGRRHEYTRSVGGPAVAALPYRTIWLVPGQEKPLGAWAPLGYAFGSCVALALFAVGTYVTLYFIPGSLIRELLA